MHCNKRRFLILGFAFLFFVACGTTPSETKGLEGAQEAEAWNKKKAEEGVPLSIIDTFDPSTELPESRTPEPLIDTLEQKLIDAGLVNVQSLDPSILVELKYASKDNFLKKNVYGGLRRCYMQPEAADKLAKASAILQEQRPDLRLLVYDAVRPRSVQFAMWRIVKGTSQQSYVASPTSGSVHNFGAAVDLTLADKTGQPLDMGTVFDFFGKKAQPRYENQFLASGELTQEQVDNRLLLRNVMIDAGFSIIRNEWWHFNAFPAAESRKRFKPVP